MFKLPVLKRQDSVDVCISGFLWTIIFFKGAIHQYCFVYMKPFNFVNSQNDVNAILSCLGF